MSGTKVLAVIPARYGSSRFPGKPLADICGKPMIWWVVKRVEAASGISGVYVATDDERIVKACEGYGIKAVMTGSGHCTHLDRLAEFASKVPADFYVNVNGDEPLVDVKTVEALVPDETIDPGGFYAANAMMVLRNPIDAVDTSKIKVAVDSNGKGLYLSRTPIPFPKGTSAFEYKKFVGVQCFSRSALEFVARTPRGELEGTEDIDEFRFIENGADLYFVLTDACTLAVDTPKDLEYVRRVISAQGAGVSRETPA